MFAKKKRKITPKPKIVFVPRPTVSVRLPRKGAMDETELDPSPSSFSALNTAALLGMLDERRAPATSTCIGCYVLDSRITSGIIGRLVTTEHRYVIVDGDVEVRVPKSTEEETPSEIEEYIYADISSDFVKDMVDLFDKPPRLSFCLLISLLIKAPTFAHAALAVAKVFGEKVSRTGSDDNTYHWSIGVQLYDPNVIVKDMIDATDIATAFDEAIIKTFLVPSFTRHQSTATVTYESDGLRPTCADLQTIEGLSELSEGPEPGGYCSVWASFIAILVAAHKSRAPYEISENIILEAFAHSFTPETPVEKRKAELYMVLRTKAKGRVMQMIKDYAATYQTHADVFNPPIFGARSLALERAGIPYGTPLPDILRMLIRRISLFHRYMVLTNELFDSTGTAIRKTGVVATCCETPADQIELYSGKRIPRSWRYPNKTSK